MEGDAGGPGAVSQQGGRQGAARCSSSGSWAGRAACGVGGAMWSEFGQQETGRSGDDSPGGRVGGPPGCMMLMWPHRHSRAAKELTLVQDPTLAPLPSYAAAWPLLAFPPSRTLCWGLGTGEGQGLGWAAGSSDAGKRIPPTARGTWAPCRGPSRSAPGPGQGGR